MPGTPPGSCSSDRDAESWDGQGWHGLNSKDLFGKNERIVATFERAGRDQQFGGAEA